MSLSLRGEDTSSVEVTFALIDGGLGVKLRGSAPTSVVSPEDGMFVGSSVPKAKLKGSSVTVPVPFGGGGATNGVGTDAFVNGKNGD